MGKHYMRGAVLGTALVLSACHGSDVERAGIGAAAGGVGAVALGASVAPWILVGAAGGALSDDIR
ncbi:MAG: hypothetical protein AAFY65_10785 [Pseudomonadota bacterium]